MSMNERERKKGEFIITIKDLDGNIIDKYFVCNQLTTAGQVLFARVLASTLPWPASNDLCISSFQFGTDDTPADKSDTALGASVLTKAVTSRHRSGTDVLTSCSVGSDEANGTVIKEIGAFLGDGTMWARTIVNIDKNENIVIDVERVDSVIY